MNVMFVCQNCIFLTWRFLLQWVSPPPASLAVCFSYPQALHLELLSRWRACDACPQKKQLSKGGLVCAQYLRRQMQRRDTSRCLRERLKSERDGVFRLLEVVLLTLTISSYLFICSSHLLYVFITDLDFQLNLAPRKHDLFLTYSHLSSWCYYWDHSLFASRVWLQWVWGWWLCFCFCRIKTFLLLWR